MGRRSEGDKVAGETRHILIFNPSGLSPPDFIGDTPNSTYFSKKSILAGYFEEPSPPKTTCHSTLNYLSPVDFENRK
ncbi:MAG: hypothetical protein CO189_02825 [candidate division Zixibacteria bacterium CG_4_9_14_3_um_filter_46_8]|nr:MAG: hypothetical protein CO189_02825 [candidate division Zixibacteria bacterium CG_4_9_14_3_um_filter_46_8]